MCCEMLSWILIKIHIKCCFLYISKFVVIQVTTAEIDVEYDGNFVT